MLYYRRAPSREAGSTEQRRSAANRCSPDSDLDTAEHPAAPPWTITCGGPSEVFALTRRSRQGREGGCILPFRNPQSIIRNATSEIVRFANIFYNLRRDI